MIQYYGMDIMPVSYTHLFETNTIGVEKEVLNVDYVIETANHFRCIDMIIAVSYTHLHMKKSFLYYIIEN